MKNQWIEAIRGANNDNYNGSGLVCSNHFSADEIRRIGSRFQLIKGSIPSVFLVDCIEFTDETDGCDNCNSMKSKIDELQAKIMKLTLDSQINETKLQDNIKKLQSSLAEKTQEMSKFKKQHKIIEKLNSKITKMENEIFVLKTTPNIKVCTIFLIVNTFLVEIVVLDILFNFRSIKRKS